MDVIYLLEFIRFFSIGKWIQICVKATQFSISDYRKIYEYIVRLKSQMCPSSEMPHDIEADFILFNILINDLSPD